MQPFTYSFNYISEDFGSIYLFMIKIAKRFIFPYAAPSNLNFKNALIIINMRDYLFLFGSRFIAADLSFIMSCLWLVCLSHILSFL